MALMDEFKEEREKLKEQPLKKKASYFWTYYKWYVLGSLLAVIILVTVVREIVTSKDTVLYSVAINGYPMGEENIFENAFMEYAGFNKDKEEIFINTTLRMSDDSYDASSMDATQFMMVYIAASDLDVCIMDPPPFEHYTYGGIYMDLRTCLSEEMLASLSGKLYYMDNAVYEEIDALERDGKYEAVAEVKLPDPLKPEEMIEPIPVGIDISGCSKFTDSYYYEDNNMYLGICGNTKRLETALKFIDYIFSE